MRFPSIFTAVLFAASSALAAPVNTTTEDETAQIPAEAVIGYSDLEGDFDVAVLPFSNSTNNGLLFINTTIASIAAKEEGVSLEKREAEAKNTMEHVSSSEESIISQETYKQEKNMAINPSKENLCSTFCKEVVRNANEEEYSIGSSSEESAEVATEEVKITVDDKHYQKALNEINQFYQKFPQYLQYLYQGPIVLNPWDQVKRNAVPITPTLNREQLSTSEENSKKTVDMESTEVFTKKTKLTEEEKNRLNFLKKISQRYQKFALPQYLKTVYQHQKAMKPWIQPKTKVIPYVRYL